MRASFFCYLTIFLGVLAVNSFAVLTSTDQLVAYYDFEDYQDIYTTLDVTDNNYDLVPKSGRFYYTGGGLNANAQQFIGLGYGSAKCNFDDMTKFKNASKWSMSLWVRFLSSELENEGLSRIYSSTNRLNLGVTRSTGKASLTVWDENGTFKTLESGTLDINGGWNFLSITYNNGTLSLYSNDETAENLISDSVQMDDPDLAYAAGMTFYLGYNGNGFDGLMDEVGLFSAALDETQVEKVFDLGKEGSDLDDMMPDVVPEPTTIAILGLGFAFLKKRK